MSTELGELLVAEAEAIVEAYNAVIDGRGDAMEYGASEEELPFDKPMIQSAIRVLLAIEADAKVQELLKINYAMLGMFVPRKEAEIVERHLAAHASGSALQIANAPSIRHIQKRMLKAVQRLTAEFEAYLNE